MIDNKNGSIWQSIKRVMGTYWFADNGESNGKILAFYSKYYMKNGEI